MYAQRIVSTAGKKDGLFWRDESSRNCFFQTISIVDALSAVMPPVWYPPI